MLSGSLLLPRDEVFIALPLGLSQHSLDFSTAPPPTKEGYHTHSHGLFSGLPAACNPSAVIQRIRSPDYPQKRCCKHFSVVARVLPLLPLTAPTEHVLREKSLHQNQLRGKPACDTEQPAQVCEQCACVTCVCPLQPLSVLREKKFTPSKAFAE